MDTPPVVKTPLPVEFPPLDFAATAKPIVATVAAPQATASEVKPNDATDTNCARRGCGKPKIAGQRYCGATCRKADWRDEQKAKNGTDTTTGNRGSIKNFLREKTDKARNWISQTIAPKTNIAAPGLEPNERPSVTLGAPGVSADAGKAFRKVCRAGIKTLDRAAKGFIRWFAKRKGASHEYIEKQVIPEMGSPDEVETLSEALDDLLREMNYVPQKPAQVAFIIAAINYGAGIVSAVKAIADLPNPKEKDDQVVKE